MMDQKEFLKKLTELAEWEIPIIGPSGRKITRGPQAKQHINSEDIDWDELDEDNEPEFKPDGPNETLAPRVIRFKNQMKLCEDCNQMQENRIRSRRFLEWPQDHWREKCSCGLHLNPNTGKFDITNSIQLQTAWKKYWNFLDTDK